MIAIFDWNTNQVTWRDKSYEAGGTDPAQVALRSLAMRFDSLTEELARYASDVQRAAEDAMQTIADGYAPRPLHPQRLVDFNEALARQQALGEGIQALIHTMRDA